MYSVLQVASYFIKRGIEENNPLTPMQIMKLCYFAHGYHLALKNTPLIIENVQAWKYGPVFKNLYHDLKIYGNKKIKEIPPHMQLDNDHFEPDEQEILEAIYEELGNENGVTLSDMTHDEGTPWKKAWDDKGYSASNVVIDNESIKNHFKGMLSHE